MKRYKTTVDRKSVLEAAKTKAEERENFTFRLETSLMEKLKKECESEGVKLTWVLEELIRQFLTKG